MREVHSAARKLPCGGRRYLTCLCIPVIALADGGKVPQRGNRWLFSVTIFFPFSLFLPFYFLCLPSYTSQLLFGYSDVRHPRYVYTIVNSLL